MNTNVRYLFRMARLLIAPLLVAMTLLAGFQRAVAATTIVSTVPSNGATGVSPTAAVVFTFSTAMNPTATTADFLDTTAFESPTMTFAWSAGNTVLTCRPSDGFANNHTIQWNVSGQDAVGNSLTGTTTGSFTTVPGVNGGSGTNAVSIFQVTKYAVYGQASSAALSFTTYEFFAQTVLASNRTATSITVTIPVTASVVSLDEDALQPQRFSAATFMPNQTTFDTTFPIGNYVFNVTPAQQVTVNLPNFSQPNIPVIGNYNAAQTIDPSQPFTLMWNTYSNAAGKDWILLNISAASGGTLFQTPLFDQPGSLSGSATGVTIPAGVLPANSTNTVFVGFAHTTSVTNGGNVSVAVVATVTLFAIRTTTAGSVTGPAPTLAIIHSGTNVLLEWPTNATGYNLQFSTNLALTNWSATLPAPVVVNTNEVVTNAMSGAARFFRLSDP